jgi:hypothetical protein
VAGEAKPTQRFSWRLHVEGGEAGALDPDGGAADAAELHHALTQAAAHAGRLFAAPRSGADDEDGWELRPPAVPQPRAAPETKTKRA